jgi:hypothetical protein
VRALETRRLTACAGSDGILRLQDSATCAGSEQTVAWNQVTQGAKGPIGPPGAGEEGDPGPQGPPGVTHWPQLHEVQKTWAAPHSDLPEDVVDAYASCAANEHVVGGAPATSSMLGDTGILIYASEPTLDGFSWHVRARVAAGYRLPVVAECVRDRR